jgi:hypothetical protein
LQVSRQRLSQIKAIWVVLVARLGLTWRSWIQGQLLTQKEVLRGEGGTGAQAQEQEAHRIHEEYQQRVCEPDEEAEQAWASSHSQGTPPNYRSLSLPIVAAEGRNVQSDEDGIFAEHTRLLWPFALKWEPSSWPVLAWSYWRRRHQAKAKYDHYRRRLKS